LYTHFVGRPENAVLPANLARPLNVPVQVIRALASRGYLRVVRGAWQISRIGKIVRDPDGLIHWPIVQLSKVKRRLGNLSPYELENLCRDNKIAIYHDKVLGPIINARELNRILKILHLKKYQSPIDRVGMMFWLAGLESPDPHKMPAFNKRAEMELIRIAKLREPMRTEQAMRFVLRWRDAETIAKSILGASVDQVIAADRQRKAAWLKNRVEGIVGVKGIIDDRDGDQTNRASLASPLQVQAQPGLAQTRSSQSSRPAPARSPSGERSESARKPNPSAHPKEIHHPSRTARQ